ASGGVLAFDTDLTGRFQPTGQGDILATWGNPREMSRSVGNELRWTPAWHDLAQCVGQVAQVSPESCRYAVFAHHAKPPHEGQTVFMPTRHVGDRIVRMPAVRFHTVPGRQPELRDVDHARPCLLLRFARGAVGPDFRRRHAVRRSGRTGEDLPAG